MGFSLEGKGSQEDAVAILLTLEMLSQGLTSKKVNYNLILTTICSNRVMECELEWRKN